MLIMSPDGTIARDGTTTMPLSHRSFRTAMEGPQLRDVACRSVRARRSQGVPNLNASHRLLVVAGLVSALVLAACDPSVLTPLPEVTINTAEYSFDAPGTMQTGVSRITFQNPGKELHHAQLVRINDCVSFDQFAQTMQEQPEHKWPNTWTGGASLVEPTGTATVTLDLEPGRYALLRFVPGADGVRHLAEGTARSPLQRRAEPSAVPPHPICPSR